MVVQHNLQAMNANRMLNVTTENQTKATEKLSSGYKINRAADDAAGLAISEKMRKQIRGLDQASANAQDGISSVQTAEGALTEIHSMLQRMNELAVQAANGTNSQTDRESIQDEIAELTTEIDRVAETTKFNETYLLKGNGKTCTLTIDAKNAGITGRLRGVGSGTATFTMAALKYGDKINIGAKGYTIGTTISVITQKVTTGSLTSITINGITYTITTTYNGKAVTSTTDDMLAEHLITAQYAAGLIADGDTVIYGTQTYVAMKDKDGNGVGDNDASVITATKAYKLIAHELKLASSIGCDPGSEAVVNTLSTGVVSEYRKGVCTQVSFKIQEAEVVGTQGLQMTLHVGSDANEKNKIAMNIDTMNAAGLGLKNLSFVDDTGALATYAIDSIADAIAKVSAQRASLGAIQNRLEHTINNLDNVVENTTAAESQIRDTDMAEEMVEYSKNNILAQAGQSMLAQANQATQGVLSLLQG